MREVLLAHHPDGGGPDLSLVALLLVALVLGSWAVFAVTRGTGRSSGGHRDQDRGD